MFFGALASVGALFDFGAVMRKVDRLGRIVIPQELRQKYGLTEGITIEFLDSGDGITVRASDSLCKICRRKISDNATLPLCEACISEAVKSYKKQK